MKNLQWRLKSRPNGALKVSDFECVETDIGTLQEGELLAKSLYFGFEASMRGWIEDFKTYAKPVQVGDIMVGPSVVQVVESKHPIFKVGDILRGGDFGWQQYAVSRCEADYMGEVKKIAEGVDPQLELSVFGWAGLAAYFGLLDVGDLRPGDNVLVSAAAGATGSVASQLARIRGAGKVVGIAGGPAKCRWLIEEAGCDAAIDYKAGDLEAQLKSHFPKGVDLFFDNVGGEILDSVLTRMALRGRVVLCGAVSNYDEGDMIHGARLRNFLFVITRGLTVKGLFIFDHMDRAQDAVAEMNGWIAEGKLKAQIDQLEGFENVPVGFLRLFSGHNLGKQLVRIADPV